MQKSGVSVKKNIAYNIIYQIVALALPLISMPYVSRVLGSAQIGRFSFDNAMVSYFTIVAVLGSSTYGQRVIAFYKGDKSELSATFWNTFFFRFITSAVALAAYFLYLSLFRGFTLLNVMVALNIFNVAIDITWFFQGIENFKSTVIRGLFIKILAFALTFILIRTQNDVWIYALITCGSTVLGNAFLWLGIHKLVTRPKKVRPFNNFKDVFLMFLPTVASQVYLVLDKTMIGWIAQSDYANGCYEQAEKIVRAALLAVTAVCTVTLSRVANLHGQGRGEEAKAYVYQSYRLVWAMALPIMFGFCSVARLFIPLYLGEGYDMAVTLFMIFSLLLVFVGLASVTGLSYLVPTKQQNVYTVSVAVSAGVNLILNIFLIKRFSAYGAAVASVTAECVGACIQIGYCVAKKQLSLKKILLPAGNYLLSAVVMTIAVLAVQYYIENGTVAFIASVACGVVVYGLMLMLLRDELALGVLKIIKGLFKRNKTKRTEESDDSDGGE